MRKEKINKINQSKKAFTLVELIVVVTILAILSTIGFVSFSGYLAGVRDTNRISQLKSMSDALHLHSVKKSLPIPDNKIDIMASGSLIAFQGFIGKSVLGTIRYTTEGLDPRDNTYFSYYLTRDRKYFQLMTMLEEPSKDIHANNRNILAVDFIDRHPFVSGNKLGILTDEFNTPIQKIGAIQTAGSLELYGDATNYIANYSNSSKVKLPGRNIQYRLKTWGDRKYKAPLECPTGFIGAPGDAQFNQRGFCVAQYEMSYDETTPRDSTGGHWSTRAYNASKTPVSMRNRLPIVEITQSQAIEQCKKIGAHLITNNQWMSLARNIELQKENYISGGVGNGILKTGVSNDLSMGCRGKQDGTLWAGPTGSDCNGTHRNRLFLSNGKAIYDLSGNVREHVNKANTIDGAGFNLGQTSVAGSSNGASLDDDGIYYTGDMNKYGSIYYLGTASGMGNLFFANGRANNIFLRGADANRVFNPGVFSLNLGWDSGTSGVNVGFRCVTY